MKWRSKRLRGSSDAILRRIDPLVSASETGVSVEFAAMPIWDAYVELLSSAIVFNTSTDPSQRGTLVKRTIAELKRSDVKLEATAFLKTLEKEERRSLRRRPKQFTVLSTVSVRPRSSFRGITLEGISHRFTLRSPAGLTLPELAKKSRFFEDHASSGYCFVRTSVLARDAAGAMDRATASLDTVRALWTLGLSFRSWRISLGDAAPTPVSPVTLGPLHTVHDDSGLSATDNYWWEPEYRQPRKVIDLDPRADGLAGLVKEARLVLRNEKFGEAFRTALHMYIRSLDHADHQTAFVRLWAVLEQLTGTGRAPYDVTVWRASSVWIDRDFSRQVLEGLRSVRNEFVHNHHSFDSAEQLLWQLKTFVDQLLVVFMGLRHRLESFAEFVELQDLSSDRELLRRGIKLRELAMDRA